MAQNLLYFKLLCFFILIHRLFRSYLWSMVMLQLGNMDNRVKFDAGWKVQLHGYGVDDLQHAIWSNPASRQLPGEVPWQHKVISLEPNEIPSREVDIPAVLVGRCGHGFSCSLEMMFNLGVNLRARRNKFSNRLYRNILQTSNSSIQR